MIMEHKWFSLQLIFSGTSFKIFTHTHPYTHPPIFSTKVWECLPPLHYSMSSHTALYILSLMNFVLQNQERFTPNIEVHNFNTRNKLKLHKPVSSLTLYQKGVYNLSIRVFNKLPKHVKNLAGNKIFISTLRQYPVRKAL